MKYGIEKAIAAAIEPLIDDVSMEKAVEQLRVALEKNAQQPEQSSAEVLRVAKR